MKKSVIVTFALAALIISQSPDFASVDGSSILQGIELFNSKNYKKAVFYFNKISPSYLLADMGLYYKAMSYNYSRQYSKAIATLDELIKKYPECSLDKMYFILGGLCEKIGDNTNAHRYYEAVICNYPASAYFRDSDDRLVFLIKKYGYQYPDRYSDGLYKHGIELYRCGKYDSARYYFAKCNTKESFRMLAKSEYFAGSLRDATKYFTTICGWSNDAAAEAYYYMGQIYLRRGHTDHALSYFNAVIKYFPNSDYADDSLYKIGYLCEKNDDTSGALTAYEKLARTYKNSNVGDDVYWRAGKLLYRSNNYGRAKDYFSDGAAQYPKSGLADACLYWEAKSYEKMGRHDDSKRILQRLVLKYDKTYYANKAREKLGYHPDIHKNSPVFFSDNVHFKKFYELKSMGLYLQALEEAALIAQDQISKISSSTVYYSLGKYDKAISSMDDLYRSYSVSPSTEALPSEVWKIYYPRGFDEHVYKYSKTYGVDPYLVFALIREESRYNVYAKSWASAYGLTQIIPSTGRKIARQMKIKHFAARKLYNPQLSIKMSVFHLAELMNNYRDNKIFVLAAYNAGPTNVRKWINKYGCSDLDEFVENIPYNETRLYVKKVMNSYYEYKKIYGSKELADL